MSEIEVPLEQIQEDIHHHAHQAGQGGGGKSSFVSQGALLSAIFAVLAAISALFAGHFSNEAMMLQIQSADHWSQYQAKGIKLSIAEMRNELKSDDSINQKIERYKLEQEEISKEASLKEEESKRYLHKHENLATTVTFYQVAIAMVAIAILTNRKQFLNVSRVLGVLGLIWMFRGFL